MAASSLSLLLLSPPPKLTKLFPSPNSSILSSPKPRTRRKNHLRPKLPTKPQAPFHIIDPSHPAILIQEEEKEQQQEEEEVALVEESTYESRILVPVPNPGPNPNASLTDGSFLLDLSLRFSALIAVQTVVAVWLFRRGLKHEGESQESNLNAGVSVLSVEVAGEGKVELSDFERVVSEIQSMAREAREREAKELERNEKRREEFQFAKPVSGEERLKEVSSGGSLGSKKRLGFVRSNVRRRRAGKGFHSAKKMEGTGNGGNAGGIQQITHQNPMRESLNLHELRQPTEVLSELTENSADMEVSLLLPCEEPVSVGNLRTSQRKIERSENNKTVNQNSKQRKSPIKQSFREGGYPTSAKVTKPGKINGRSKSSQNKNVGKSVTRKYEDDMFDIGRRHWWLELPFVLAILLRRGSDSSHPKGLYSLKMGSSPDDGDSVPYTILFQDQGDASNFCYLLESFFEDLDDFSADVVPLMVDELEEGVGLKGLNIIVVRKGQLLLYAGQPLVEVETALRSLLEEQKMSDRF